MNARGFDISYGCTEQGYLCTRQDMESTYSSMTVYGRPQCRLLNISNGHRNFCLVSLDVMDIDSETAARAREAVGRALGIPESAVWITWTHNHYHCQFGMISGDKVVDAVLKTAGQSSHQRTVDRIAKIEVRTGDTFNVNRRADAPHGMGRFSVWQCRHCTDDGNAIDGTGWARNIMKGYKATEEDLQGLSDGMLLTRAHDDQLQLILFGGQQEPVAGIVRFAAHPVVPRDSNNATALSRDYFGALVDRLEELWGCPFIFVQGPAGDQRVRHSAQTQEECRRIGHGLAALLHPDKVCLDWKGFADIHTSLSIHQFPINPDIPSDSDCVDQLLKEAEAQLDALPHGSAYLAERKRIGERLLLLTRTRSWAGRKTIDVPLSYSRLGPFFLLGFPAELSSVFSRKFQPRPDDAAVICGYANGCVGYLLDEDDYLHGGYEAWASRVSSGAVKDIIATAEGLVAQQGVFTAV